MITTTADQTEKAWTERAWPSPSAGEGLAFTVHEGRSAP